MDEKLRSLGPALRQRLSKSDQVRQELEIIGRQTPDTPSTPESSQLRSTMFRHIEKNDQRMLDDAVMALRRAAVSSRVVRRTLVNMSVFKEEDAIVSLSDDQIKSSFREIFYSERLKYAFVQKHVSSPGVYRILIQSDNNN